VGDGDSVTSGSPWAAAFDPVANMRALADVQVRSARAAGELIERLIARVDGDTATNGGQAGAPRPTASPAVGMEQLVELWAGLAKGVLESLGRVGQTGLPATDGPVLDVAAAGPAAAVTVAAGATTAVWLHNSSHSDVTDVRLHCTELRDHNGATLPPTALCFAPAAIESLPARSSREITIVAAEPDGHAPGAYRGAILASGLPAVWLPVELVVALP
jgi:hypothetical protein